MGARDDTPIRIGDIEIRPAEFTAYAGERHTHFGFGYRLATEDPSGPSQLLHNGVTTA